ncbi:MAG: glycosyltransferase family 39 protein [Pseudomonadota bacterium]
MNLSPATRLLLILLLLTLWRLATASHVGMELYADEAQYWTWSLAPDWGYYSKPPMVAWAIWLGSHLFGEGELGVRAVSVAVYPVTAWLLFLLARRLFAGDPRAERIAFWSGLAYATLPMVSMGAWLITTDAFLILFWSLSLLALHVALSQGRWRDWLVLGLAVGLGLLSKYSMVFFGLGVLAYLAVSAKHRRWLRDPRPYAAMAVALVVLAPNIAWNAAHQFVSYQHTAEISKLDESLFNPDAMLAFFGAQFGVFGPITFAVLLGLALRFRGWFADDRLRFLAAFSLVPLAAFIAMSLLSRAFANWGAFAYAAGAVLVAATLVRGERMRLLGLALGLNLAIAAGLYHWHDLRHAAGIEASYKFDPYRRVTGYRALGGEVSKRLAAEPGTRLLVDDRKLYALMRYYARPESDDARYFNPSRRLNNHYALTADLHDQPQGTYLLLSDADLSGELPRWFDHIEPLPPIRLQLYPDHAPTYHLWRVSGYRAPTSSSPVPETR